MRHLAYTQLFKEIAQQHPVIAHQVNGKKSFVRIIRSTGDPFEDKLYLEDFIVKNSTSLKYPCLVLFSYNHSYEGEPDQVKFKKFNGMFAVLNIANLQGTNTKEPADFLDEALDSCELIAEQVFTMLENTLEETCTMSRGEEIMAEKSGPNAQNIVAQSIYFSFKKSYPMPQP